jgi:hypothetical protein
MISLFSFFAFFLSRYNELLYFYSHDEGKSERKDCNGRNQLRGKGGLFARVMANLVGLLKGG